MMWQIVIIMFLPLSTDLDAVEVTHYNGKLLEFQNEEACYRHVEKNLITLKAFAQTHYPDVPVKSVNCFRKPRTI